MGGKRKATGRPRGRPRRGAAGRGAQTQTPQRVADVLQARELASEYDDRYAGADLDCGLVAGVLQVSEGAAPAVNQVRVDELELAAEADGIALEAAVEAAAAAPAGADGAAPQVENAEEGYKLLAFAMVAQGADLFAPNWALTIPEKSELSDAVVQALMLWFPDGLIPPRYLALLVIAGIGAKIAFKRRDPETGRVTPRHATKPKPASDDAAKPAVATVRAAA